MIEMRRLKNVVIFTQTILSFMLSRKMINISDYIGKLVSPFLCRYRKSFNTQYALLTVIERWKFCLDRQGFAGALLMVLSKAFEKMNHELLIDKLHIYGFSTD